MSTLADYDTLDLCQAAGILADAQHFTTHHMASTAVHQGIDRQGCAFIVVTDGAGESLVIRPQDLGHAPVLRLLPPAANDGA